MVRIEMKLHPDEAELVWQALALCRQQLRADGKSCPPDAVTADKAVESGSADLSAERTSAAPTLADAVVALAEHRLASAEEGKARPGGERRLLMIHLREDQLEGSFRAELHNGTPLSTETLLRCACDSGIVAVKTDKEGNGEVLDIGRKTRTPSPALMRALRMRHRRCVWPGCTCEAYLEAHHLEHWAQGGETSLLNTTILCWLHHGQVHEGGFGIERNEDGQLLFSDPDGRRIEPAPSPPLLQGDAMGRLVAEQQRAGIDIDQRTSLPDWDGRPLDLDGAVSALLMRGRSGSC